MESMVNAVRVLAMGGYVMIPLMICSVVSLAVMIERFVRIRAAQRDMSGVINRAENELYLGNYQVAINILESEDSPVTRVLAAGVRHAHLGERAAERAMEEQGTREIHDFGRKLGALDTIVTIAPLLGLLGTVTGMISAFHVIAAKEGISTPTAITGGVAEALIATATGLAIAIATLVGYNHLQERIKSIVAEMEARGSAMVNVLVDTYIGEDHVETKRLSA